MEKSNVIKVPPRRYQVNYKGQFGYVEYKPSTKQWHWSFKAVATLKNDGIQETKEAAELELKKFIDAAAMSKHIRSVD